MRKIEKETDMDREKNKVYFRKEVRLSVLDAKELF